MAESRALTVTDHERMLVGHRDRLEQWVSPKSTTRADALIRHALHEISTDSKLRECSPASLYLGVLACAVTGLVPGKLRGQAFLIPFSGSSTFMIGWKGYKVIGYRAGINIVSDVVHQGDDFDFDKGSSPFIRHRPAKTARGPLIGAYAYAQLPRDGLEIEWLDLEELQRIEQVAQQRGRSPAWSGPFKDQMQRKSAIRRLGKHIEMGEESFRADMLESAEDDGLPIVHALDEITSGEASRAVAGSIVETAAFSALPAPAPQERTPEVNTQVPSRARNTRDPEPGPSPSRASTGRGAASSRSPASAPPTSSETPAAGSSKFEDAKAAARARDANPSAGAATSAPAVSPATPSESPSTTEPSSSADGDRGDVAMEPPPDGDFDASFGDEDPEDAPPPAEKSLAAFYAWLRNCRSADELRAGKAEWIKWSKDKFAKKSDPEPGDMQSAYAKRLAELGGAK